MTYSYCYYYFSLYRTARTRIIVYSYNTHPISTPISSIVLSEIHKTVSSPALLQQHLSLTGQHNNMCLQCTQCKLCSSRAHLRIHTDWAGVDIDTKLQERFAIAPCQHAAVLTVNEMWKQIMCGDHHQHNHNQQQQRRTTDGNEEERLEHATSLKHRARCFVHTISSAGVMYLSVWACVATRNTLSSAVQCIWVISFSLPQTSKLLNRSKWATMIKEKCFTFHLRIKCTMKIVAELRLNEDTACAVR